jgi:hypothetical protein
MYRQDQLKEQKTAYTTIMYERKPPELFKLIKATLKNTETH